MDQGKFTCASCGKAYSSAMRDCPFCGAQKEEKAVERVRSCPVCRVAMEQREHREETVDVCAKCSGMWLDKGEFDKLTSLRDTMADPSVPYEYRKGGIEKREQYVACPCCGKLMVRENFRKISGVIIDVCGNHGAWFDAGELERIRAFVANGGVDASQDRLIDANKDDISLLKTRVVDLEMMEKILHKWEFKRLRYRKF